jgi:hypothetical protein
LFVDKSKIQLEINKIKFKIKNIQIRLLCNYEPEPLTLTINYMHIAYSAFRVSAKKSACSNHHLALYQGYLAACEKHQETIAAIQEYLPGWRPALPADRSGSL